MKATGRQIKDAINGLNAIARPKTSDIRLIYRIGHIVGIVNDQFRKITEAQNQLVSNLGKFNEKTKQKEILPDSENWETYIGEIKKLNNDVVEFEMKTLPLSMIEASNKIAEEKKTQKIEASGSDMADMMWLIDYDLEKE